MQLGGPVVVVVVVVVAVAAVVVFATIPWLCREGRFGEVRSLG